MNGKNKILIAIISILTIISVGGITYAFFTANGVQNNVNTNNIQSATVKYGDIIVSYDNSNGQINTGILDLKESQKGRDYQYLIKFRVQSTANINRDITIRWSNLINTFCQYQNNGACTNNSSHTFVGNEVNYNLYNCTTVGSYNDSAVGDIKTACQSIGTNSVPVTNSVSKLHNESKITLEATSTNYYILLLTIKNTNGVQNYQQNKNLTGRIEIKRYNLPSEYQEVAYIQTSGNQYLDLGKPISSTEKIKFHFLLTTDPNGPFFGATNSEDRSLPNNFSFSFCDDARQPCIYATGASGGLNYYNKNNVLTLNEIHTFEWFGTTATIPQFDGVNMDIVGTPALSIPTVNSYLFARNRNNESIYYSGSGMRVYSFIIENVMDLIPCYRVADNITGMYDILNDVFYERSGTGEFTIGSNV